VRLPIKRIIYNPAISLPIGKSHLIVGFFIGVTMNCTKRCTKCQGEFPATLEFFHKKINGKHGVTTKCKNCSKAYNREQYNKHKTKILQQKKEYHKENINKRNSRDRDRRKTDNKFRLKCNLRSRICHAISGIVKSKRTTELVGCSIDDLKLHLEKQFVDGMNWENYGLHGWHVDHIRPCCSFDLTDPEQQRECFHYTNLQPLWAKDNLAKGGSFHE